MELNKENIDKKMDFIDIRRKISILEKKFDDNTISGEEIIELIKLYKSKNKPKTKQCGYCGKTFEYTRSNQKYCSKDCSKAVKNKSRKESYRKSKTNKKPKTKQCLYCGKTFEFTSGRQKYCNEDCSKAVKEEKDKEYARKAESDKLLEILQEREDLRKIRPKDKDYKLKKYMVKAGLNEKSTWTIERDYYFFKPCKFDKNNESIYYIHDFNDNNDFSASLIKLTDTSLSEKEFEYYKSKGNLVFYEKLN